MPSLSMMTSGRTEGPSAHPSTLANRAGYPPGYSAHSLRAELATSTATAGLRAGDHEPAGHRSLVVAQGYIARGRCSSTTPAPRLACDPVTALRRVEGCS